MENFKKSRDELKFQGRRKEGGDDVEDIIVPKFKRATMYLQPYYITN